MPNVATEPLLVFSSDCHGGPLADEYRDYLPMAHHAALDDHLAASGEDRFHPKDRPGMHDRENRVRFATRFETRLADLEADGIVGEVVFPDSSAGNRTPFTAQYGNDDRYSAVLHDAAFDARNRWMGEHCHKTRQVGLAMISLRDPATALDAVRKIRGYGLKGICPQYDGLDRHALALYDPALDPIWGACVDDDLTVNFHGATGVPAGIYQSAAGRHVFGQEVGFWCRRPLWHLVLGGVLERFPQLRVGFTEMHCDWVPDVLRRLDRQWEPPVNATRAVLDGYTGESLRDVCPGRPSEYWHRQCFVGASTMSRVEAELRHEIGVQTLMIGTDHPHSASSWKCTREYLRMLLGDTHVPHDEARAMLGTNLVELYGLDVAELAAVARRVGPRVEEILRPSSVEDRERIPEYLRPRIMAIVERENGE